MKKSNQRVMRSREGLSGAAAQAACLALALALGACSSTPVEPSPQPRPTASPSPTAAAAIDAGAGGSEDGGAADASVAETAPEPPRACPEDMLLIDGDYCTDLEMTCLKSWYAPQNKKTIC